MSRHPAGKAEEEGDPFTDLLTYLNRSGCFPAFAGTETTYFPLGEDKFEAMLRELRKAEKYIFMEYFIIEEGHMWGKIQETLKQCRQVTEESIWGTKAFYKIMGPVVKLIAPLM